MKKGFIDLSILILGLTALGLSSFISLLAQSTMPASPAGGPAKREEKVKIMVTEGASCSPEGAWQVDCIGERQSCNEDAGVGKAYHCEGGKWVFKYPECNTKCKVSAPTAPTQPPQPAPSQICNSINVACQEDYNESCGQQGHKRCHKQGTCTCIGAGPCCSWGAGSYCGDCVSTNETPVLPTPAPSCLSQGKCEGAFRCIDPDTETQCFRGAGPNYCGFRCKSGGQWVLDPTCPDSLNKLVCNGTTPQPTTPPVTKTPTPSSQVPTPTQNCQRFNIGRLCGVTPTAQLTPTSTPQLTVTTIPTTTAKPTKPYQEVNLPTMNPTYTPRPTLTPQPTLPPCPSDYCSVSYNECVGVRRGQDVSQFYSRLSCQNYNAATVCCSVSKSATPAPILTIPTLTPKPTATATVTPTSTPLPCQGLCLDKYVNLTEMTCEKYRRYLAQGNCPNVVGPETSWTPKAQICCSYVSIEETPTPTPSGPQPSPRSQAPSPAKTETPVIQTPTPVLIPSTQPLFGFTGKYCVRGGICSLWPLPPRCERCNSCHGFFGFAQCLQTSVGRF